VPSVVTTSNSARNTCLWLVRGGTLAALQQLLGHASIVTTQRYAKLSDEAVMREAQRLQSPMGTASVTQVSPANRQPSGARDAPHDA